MVSKDVVLSFGKIGLFPPAFAFFLGSRHSLGAHQVPRRHVDYRVLRQEEL